MISAIVEHIYGLLGIDKTKLFTDKYCIDKVLSIELDDGSNLSKKIYGSEGKVGESTIRLVAADVSASQDLVETVLILQFDKLTIYALKLESGLEARSKVFFASDLNGQSWTELSNLLLAKLLVGAEQLNQLFVVYQPIKEYTNLYENLVGFLNYEENH